MASDPAPGLFGGPARYVPRSPWGPASALLAVLLVAAGSMLAVTVGFLLIATISGVAPETLLPAADPGAILASSVGVTLALAIHLLIIAGIWRLADRQGRRPEVLSFDGPAPSYAVCVLAGLAIVAASGLLELTLRFGLGARVEGDASAIIKGLQSPAWLGTVFLAIVIAPLWEEIVFRGFLLSALAQSRLGIMGGALVTNTLWTLLHSDYSVAGLASVFLAGAMLTWFLWRTGSIRIAIVAHAVYNAVALAAIWFILTPA